MSKKTRIILISIVSVFVIIQFIPVDRTNPPTDPNAKISAPPEVMSVLQRSCFDCHSNETKWPFYSYVAPVSWFVADDVSEGRRHVNFSEWEKLSTKRQERKKEHIWDEVSEGDMPMQAYLIIHRDAKLSKKDVEIIKNWTNKTEQDSSLVPGE